MAKTINPLLGGGFEALEPVGTMEYLKLILNLNLRGSTVPGTFNRTLPGLISALTVFVVLVNPLGARQTDPILLQSIQNESALPQETQSTPKYDFAPPVTQPRRSIAAPVENNFGSGMTGVTPRDSSGGQLGGFVTPLNRGDQSNSQLDVEPKNRRLPGGQKAVAETSGRVEVIRERYPDGKVQIMRQVTQDKDQNYFNHGSWQLFNRRGEFMGQGEYYLGRMEGQWKRWHPSKGAELFSAAPFNQFQGPYLSSAEFSNGKLHGVWTIADREKSSIFEVSYQDGIRHGTATWYHTNGSRMRECIFREGVLDGPLFEWDADSKVTRKEEYIQGRRIVSDVQYAGKRQKLSESFYLAPKLELEGEDNWWEAKPASFVSSGKQIQHGPTGTWHSNGQPKMQGQYINGQRVGPFVGWHANGQKDVAGQFNAGKKVGTWIWWHANGQKRIEGQYDNNTPTGVWTWWNEDGSVRKQQDITALEGNEESKDDPESTDTDNTAAEETGEEEEIGAEEVFAEELPPKADESKIDTPPVDEVDIPDDVIPYKSGSSTSDSAPEKNGAQGSDSRDTSFDESPLNDESRWMDLNVLDPVETGELNEGNLQRNLDTESQDDVPQSDEQRHPRLQPPAPIEDPFGDDGSRHAQASA